MSRPQPESVLVTPKVLRDWRLPEPTGGKESRGSILVVGGSTETLGAVTLAAEAALRSGAGKLQVVVPSKVAPHVSIALPEALVRGVPSTEAGAIRASSADRSEEHTSELQSRQYLVCRLLLEKHKLHYDSPNCYPLFEELRSSESSVI